MAISYPKYKLLGTVKYRYPNREVEVVDFDRVISGLITEVNSQVLATTTITDDDDGNTYVTVAGSANEIIMYSDGEQKVYIDNTVIVLQQDTVATAAELALAATSFALTLSDGTGGASSIQTDNAGGIVLSMAATGGASHNILYQATGTEENLTNGSDTYAKSKSALNEDTLIDDGTNTGEIFQDTVMVQLSVHDTAGIANIGTVKVEKQKVTISTNPGYTLNNGVTVTESSGVEIETEDHINLKFTSTGDLQLNGSAGVVGNMVQSTGAGTAPIYTSLQFGVNLNTATLAGFGHYTSSGTTNTSTLPTVAGNTKGWYTFLNMASGNWTIGTTAAANEIFNAGSLTNSYVLAAGASARFYNNGTAWFKLT